MSYRPLPNSLTIKTSTVDGLGLFAREFIASGKVLGVTHWLFNDMSPIRTPLGGFINHSDDPNSELFINTDRAEMYYGLRTIKNLAVGDEVTVKYQHFNPFRP